MGAEYPCEDIPESNRQWRFPQGTHASFLLQSLIMTSYRYLLPHEYLKHTSTGRTVRHCHRSLVSCISHASNAAYTGYHDSKGSISRISFTTYYHRRRVYHKHNSLCYMIHPIIVLQVISCRSLDHRQPTSPYYSGFSVPLRSASSCHSLLCLL